MRNFNALTWAIVMAALLCFTTVQAEDQPNEDSKAEDTKAKDAETKDTENKDPNAACGFFDLSCNLGKIGNDHDGLLRKRLGY